MSNLPCSCRGASKLYRIVLVFISVSNLRSSTTRLLSKVHIFHADYQTWKPFEVANMPLTREERRLAWESMGLYKGPGNYRYGYSDARTGLTYGYPGVRRNSTDDVRKQLENKKGLTKHWMIGQLLLWGATEQKGLEKTRKDEVLGLVWDALNSGKVSLKAHSCRVIANSELSSNIFPQI
jgi:hypothetical protein